MEEVKEEKTVEGKYFHVENIGKNLVTTVIGIVLMSVSAFAFMIQWFVVLPVKPEWWQLAIAFALGLMLLFARDKVVTYVDIFTRKKIDKN